MKRIVSITAMALLAAAGCNSANQSHPSAANPAVTQLQPTPAPVPVADTQAPQPAPEPVASIDTTTPPAPDNSVGLGGTASPGESRYVVKAGDTLYHIALTHYGDGKQWKKIVSANPGLSPKTLRAGQTITLP